MSITDERIDLNVGENSGRKRLNVVSLVLGILAVVFSVSLPGAAYSCGIPGLVIAVKRKGYNSRAGFALSIIAVSVAAVNSVIAVIVTAKMFRRR
jgi:hypothetical protein